MDLSAPLVELQAGIAPSIDESDSTSITFSFSLKDPKLMNKARFEVAYYEKGTIFNGAWVERTVSGKDLVLKERLDESGQLLGLSNWVQCTIQELLPARSYIFKVRVKGGQHPWSDASEAMQTAALEMPPPAPADDSTGDGTASASVSSGQWFAPEEEAENISTEWTPIDQSGSESESKSEACALSSSASLFQSDSSEAREDSNDHVEGGSLEEAAVVGQPLDRTDGQIVATDPRVSELKASLEALKAELAAKGRELEASLETVQSHKLQHEKAMQSLEQTHAEATETLALEHEAKLAEVAAAAQTAAEEACNISTAQASRIEELEAANAKLTTAFAEAEGQTHELTEELSGLREAHKSALDRCAAAQEQHDVQCREWEAALASAKEALRAKEEEYAQEALERQESDVCRSRTLSFESFSPGDIALFFPTSTKAQGGSAVPRFVAFHQGCPNYFLSPESVTELGRREDGTFSSFIIGTILLIEEAVAGPAPQQNPHQLLAGTRYHSVVAAAL